MREYTIETRLHRRTSLGVDYSYPVTVTCELNQWGDPCGIEARIKHRTGDVWLPLGHDDIRQLDKAIRAERRSDAYEAGAARWET